MGWNPFKKEEKNELEDNSLEKKINQALKEAQNDKREAENDIKKIESWAAEVIIDTYADLFPNGNLTYYREKYKEDALEKYEQIKTDNADKVPADKAEKCDRLLKGYLNQIELRKSKLKLYEKLEKDYLSTKEKLKQVEVKKLNEDKLSSHEDRLRELDGDTGAYVDAISDTAKLDELNKEFEMKAEYMNQLSKLNEKYDTEKTDDDANYNNSLAFKDELDKIINDLD